MAAKDFEVTEDVWIGNAEQRPVDPNSAEAGAFRLKKGEKITVERAAEIGLTTTPTVVVLIADEEPAAVTDAPPEGDSTDAPKRRAPAKAPADAPAKPRRARSARKK